MYFLHVGRIYKEEESPKEKGKRKTCQRANCGAGDETSQVGEVFWFMNADPFQAIVNTDCENNEVKDSEFHAQAETRKTQN